MGKELDSIIDKYGHVPYKLMRITDAIEKAKMHESKLTPEALSVPSFTSIKIRHLLNNLGAISNNYLECGVHLAGHYCSVVYGNNLHEAVGIDNYSEFNNGGETKEKALANMDEFTPKETSAILIEADCFQVKDLKKDYFDLYNYDAQHTESSQQRAVSHFLPNLTEEFIMVVDDWSFPGVESGTRNGIKMSGLSVLFEEILITPEGVAHNDSWHNSFAVFYLKQQNEWNIH